MMEPLTFIAKMIGVTARIGAAFALGAGLLVILRGMNIEPFTNIEPATYGAILTAGIIGFCTVVVEFIIKMWNSSKKLIIAFGIPYFVAKLENKKKKETALKNLETPRPDFVATLRFLRAHSLQRFLAPTPSNSELLQRMERSFLIEIDDPNYRSHASETYYRVPDYVWKRMARIEPDYAAVPVAESAPWIRKPNPHGWMSR